MRKILTSLIFVAGAQMALAASPNDHFRCQATQFFNRLQVEVQRLPDAVRIRFQGLDAARAAGSLNFTPARPAAIDVLQVDFKPEWCQLSPTTLAVVACELPTWTWPRPTLKASVLDREGNVVAEGVLGYFKLDLERAVRTFATSAGDRERTQLELDAYLISEKQNKKRATLRLPYGEGNCRPL